MQNLNKNYLAERIKYVREHIFNLSQSEMAIRSELTQRDISQIETGKKKFLPLSFIQLLNSENINLNALFDELADFEKIAANVAANVAANSKTALNIAPFAAPKVISIDNVSKRELVPLVPIKAAAGYLTGFSDPEYIGNLPTLDIPGLSGQTHRAFEIRGSSMMPTHHPGSIAIGRWVESFDEIQDRRVYIVITKYDGIVLKRVINRAKQEGKLILMSDNSNKHEYPNYPVEASEVLEIWYWRGGIIREIPEPGAVYTRINDLEGRLTMLEHRLNTH